MKIEFKFAGDAQESMMVQMADALPRIGETVQVAAGHDAQGVWEVSDVVHSLTGTGSYDRTTVFLKTKDA